MAILILVRHGRTTANAQGILAGWTPGITLDDKGVEQVARLGERLKATPLAAVVSSPLERCQQTAAAIIGAQESQSLQPGSGGGPAAEPVAGPAAVPAAEPLAVQSDEEIGECHYGAWTGRKLKELSREALWRDIQEQPSTVTFPPHDDFRAESMQGMQDRVVRAITQWDAQIEAEHGPGAVWVAVSHGDVIKSLVAHALGSPLDRFQRIMIDPASVSIVRQAKNQPFVLRVNDTGSDPVDLRGLSESLNQPSTDDNGESSDDAAVGGGAGTD
ncbi:histidine phosphatase family protein [Ornithinimicrobium faecis]|uniref:Histidine phosphatase family protein n=1 Tax=Ornithinimicrobium faecis TaxID=2934158 RepID=A0ABY4YNC0_9MICO|nr:MULTISPECIES: histidine phosphatase family protein [unclassified Ornithinimicrobium]USQ78226.1 histidine phosphatase family protein [Ornithinimicrobium sp. HY1793]